MISPLEKQVRELDSFLGRGARVLSLYLPAGGGAAGTAGKASAAELFTRLHNLVTPLWDELGEPARVELEIELHAVCDYLSSMVAPPASLAIFTCSPRRYFRVVRLSVPVMPAVYWGHTTQTGPLRALASGPETASPMARRPPVGRSADVE
jgi:hypothetical protein